MDALGLSGAVLVGLSIGGMITQALAYRRPDLVRAMVLMDTGHRIATPALWAERIHTVEAGGIEALADNVLGRWFSARFRAEDPQLPGWRRMLVTTPLDGYLASCHALAAADLTDDTRTLRQPALCLCGDEDGSTPPALVRELAGLLPNGRYVEIPGTGHLPCVEAPGTVAGLIDDFAAGVSANGHRGPEAPGV